MQEAGRGGWQGRGHGRIFQTFQKFVGTRGQNISILWLARIFWLVDYSCFGMKSSKKMTFEKLTGLFHIQTPLSLFAGKKAAQQQKTLLLQLLKDQLATSLSATDFLSWLHCPAGELTRGDENGGLLVGDPAKPQSTVVFNTSSVICTPTSLGTGHHSHHMDKEPETQVT